MDKPSTSKRIAITDPDFSDHIRGLLASEGAECETEEELSDDPVDDSDADPDYVVSDEEPDSDDSDIPEPRGDRLDNRENDNNNMYDNNGRSDGDGRPVDVRRLDEDAMSIEDGRSDEDELMLEEEHLERFIPNIMAAYSPLPEYFLERLNKKEYGPPNAWASNPPPRNVRTPSRNIIRSGLPGIIGQARELGNNPNIRDVWTLFLDEDIITKIVNHTNEKLDKVRDKIQKSKSNYRKTNFEEINALIGLLLLSSIFRSNNEKITSMFDKSAFSRPIFRLTMSIKRFDVLMECLRFDDSETRAERKETNKAAAISEIFEKIISNTQSVFCPSAYVTIDEMLVPFRGRCSFRVYMPKKPKKYGIKIVCLADTKTSYLYDAYIYTGKGCDGVGLSEDEKNVSVPTQSVLRLCKSIAGSNRNVTADNWFSSVECCSELLKRNLTYVGTLKKNKKAIPTEFLPHKDRPELSTLYGFRNDITLLSFVPKKNRSVNLVSTMHHSIETNQDKNKPEMICFYNTNKYGVDLLDMKCAVFNSSRRCRRWPLAIFYRLINVASVNSFIIYMSYSQTAMMNRFEYIKSLAHELIVPHLRKRISDVPNLPRELKMDIKKFLGVDVQPDVGGFEDRLAKRKTCEKCPPGNDRKTQTKCIGCASAICGQCQKRVCLDCAAEHF